MNPRHGICALCFFDRACGSKALYRIGNGCQRLDSTVDLRFERRDLLELCNNAAAMRRRWGSDDAAVIKQRLYEIDAVLSLADLATLPYVDIKIDRDDHVTVSACAGVRFVLRPLTRNSSGDRWEAVRELTLVDIVE